MADEDVQPQEEGRGEEVLGPCCRLLVCCEPPRAARALAADLGIPYEAALKVVQAYMLVPRRLESGPNATSEDEQAAAVHRLEKLKRRVPMELAAVLIGLGHQVEA